MAQVVGLRSIALVVNIATSLLTAALLGPSGRGEQASLVLAPTVLGSLSSLGLHASLIYNMRADPEHQRELLGNGILLTFALGSAGTLFGWVLEPHWLSQYSAHTIAVGRLLLLVTPLIVVQWSLTGAAEVRGWFGLANQMLYIQSLLTLAVLGVLAWTHGLTPTTSALAYILPMILSFGRILLTLCSRIRPRLRPRWQHLRPLLHFGLRFCGVDLLSTFASSIDQLVIVAFLPPRAMGTYVVAASSARLLTVVQSGISAVLFPSVAANVPAQVVKTVSDTFRIATLLIAALALGLALIGPPLLIWAYGPAFRASIEPFRILLGAMLLENGARILYLGYSGAGRPGLVTSFEIGGVVVSVLLMLELVSRLGTIGAALAVLGGSGFRLGAGVAALRLVVRKDQHPRLIPTHHDVRAAWRVLTRPAPAAAPDEVVVVVGAGE